MGNVHSIRTSATLADTSTDPISYAMALAQAIQVSCDPGLTCEGLGRTEIWELARAIKGTLAEVQQAQ